MKDMGGDFEGWSCHYREWRDEKTVQREFYAVRRQKESVGSWALVG